MSHVYDSWHEARCAALQLADACNLPVAIRRVREYGKERYSIKLACKMDSDYARAEIVNPGQVV